MILVPLKALAQEIGQDWGAGLPGYAVHAYTSDQFSRKPFMQADVLVMTPERLDLITRAWGRHHRWLARVGLLIVDEFHLIADPARGGRVDASLTKFTLLNPTARILAMTATCGNMDEVKSWMHADHYHALERPVPLHWNTITVKTAAQKQPELLHVLQAEPKSTLIFVHSRTRCVELAAKFPNAEAHHAGLNREQRQAVEARFREGVTTTLVCTPTLEMGVNLPCARVVLYDLTLADYTWGTTSFRPLSVNAAWQRAGRAGRAGQSGEVLVLGTRKEDPESYEHAPLEPLVSPLLWEEQLLDFLLGAVDGGFAINLGSLARLVCRTFAGFRRQVSLDFAQEEIKYLITLGALQEEAGRLNVTPLGRTASRHMLRVESVLAVTSLPEDPTALDILLVAARELQGRPRVSDELIDLVLAGLQITPSRLLDAHQIFESGVPTAALIALDACTDGDLAAAQAFDLFENQVRGWRESLARIVAAWVEYRPKLLKLRLVQVMLAAGVGLEASSLVRFCQVKFE